MASPSENLAVTESWVRIAQGFRTRDSLAKKPVRGVAHAPHPDVSRRVPEQPRCTQARALRCPLVIPNQTRTTSGRRSSRRHPSPSTVARRAAVSGAAPHEVENRLEKHIGRRGEVRQHDLGWRNYVPVEHLLRLVEAGSE